MDAIEQDDAWYHLSQIKTRILAKHPEFDERTYGQRKMSGLVAGLRRFETKQDGQLVYIRDKGT